MGHSADARENLRQEDIASDLAYVRALAEEGAHAPLVGGRHYLIWGALMAAASFFAFLNATVLHGGAVGAFAPWIIGGLLGWTLSMLTGARASAKPGGATLGNKTAGAVWLAVGAFMTVFFISLMFAHGRYTGYGVPPYFLFGLMFPIGFGVYGVAFMATATAGRVGWLRWIAVLSWVFSIATLFLIASPQQYLVGAVGMACCAAWPGFELMRREPAEIV